MSFFTDMFSSQYFGLGLMGATTGMNSYYAYQQTSLQNLANELNAKTYEQNAQLARLNAGVARKFGEQEYADTVKSYETIRGDQSAYYGASGVSVGAGSAAAVTANTAAEGIYEAQKAQYARDLEAWQLEAQASSYDFEAAKSRAGYVNPYLSAGNAALNGATKMYSYYNRST